MMYCGNRILFHGLLAIMTAVLVKSFGINIMIVPDDDPSQVICTLALLSKYFRSGESLSGSVLYMSITSASINIQQNLLRAIHMDRTHPWTVVINNPRKPHPTVTVELQEKPQCYFVIVENLENEDLDDTFEGWKSQINWNPMAQFVVYLASVEETDDEMTELMIEILLNFLNKKIYNINVIGQNDENGFFYGKTVFPYHPDNNCGNRVIAIETLDLCDYQEAEQEHNDEEEEYAYDIQENENGDGEDNLAKDEGDKNNGDGGNEYGEEEVSQTDEADEEEQDEPAITGVEGDKDVVIGEDEDEESDVLEESVDEENSENDADVENVTEQAIEDEEIDEEEGVTGAEEEGNEVTEYENPVAEDDEVKEDKVKDYIQQDENEEEFLTEDTDEVSENVEKTFEETSEKPTINEIEGNDTQRYIEETKYDEGNIAVHKKTIIDAGELSGNKKEDNFETNTEINNENTVRRIEENSNEEIEVELQEEFLEVSTDSMDTEGNDVTINKNEESIENVEGDNNKSFENISDHSKEDKNKSMNYSDQGGKRQYAKGIQLFKKVINKKEPNAKTIQLKPKRDKNKKNKNKSKTLNNSFRANKKTRQINSRKYRNNIKAKATVNNASSKNYYGRNKRFKITRENYTNLRRDNESQHKTMSPKNIKTTLKSLIPNRFSPNKNRRERTKRQNDLDFEEENVDQEPSPKYDEPVSQGTMYMEEHFRALFLDKFPRDLSGCTLVAAFRSWEPFIFSLEKPKQKKSDNPNDDTPDEESDNGDETGDEFENEAGGDPVGFGEAGDVASGVNVFGDTEIFGNTNADGDYYGGGDGPDGPEGGSNNDFEPDTSQIEADLKLSGIEYKMVQTIAERLHINIDIQVENNNLYQLFQQLIDGDIEMVVGGIDEDPSISQFVSSTIPYYQDDLTWCVARAKRQHNLFNFLATFRIDTWLLTQSCVLLLSLTVFFTQRALKVRLAQLKGYVNIVLRLFGVIITTQSMQLKSMPSTLKISLGSAFFMSLMISNIYQSFLVSTLTTPKSMFQISHIREIYHHRMSIMGSVENVRHMNKDGEIFKYIREKFQMCYNIEECLRRAATDDRIAVAVSRLHSFYNPRIPRDLLYCFDRDENLYAYLVTMLLPKKFHLLHMINPVIQHVIESGHMQKWSRDLDSKRQIEQETHQARESAVRSLNLAEVGGSFAFSGFLLLFALIVFLIECCVHRLVTQHRTRLIVVKMLHKQFS